MRLSPVVMAAVALTATLGLSHSAEAKSPLQPAKLTDRSTVSKSKPSAKDVVVKTTPVMQTSQPVETRLNGKMAPVIAQAGTIEQETPDRIQINPTAPITPTTPTLPTVPETAPITPEGQQTPSETPSEAVPTQPLQPGQPTPQPEQPTSQPGQPTQPPAEAEPRVLVSEVVVSGVDGELQQEVYRVIQTQPGRTTTRSQLQNDINAIFATGFFSNVRATPEDTPLGVRVTFEVTANPPLKSVQLEGSKVVPADVVNRIFSPQYGKITNFRDLQSGIQELTKYYQDRGFVLAQVINAQQPQINPDGTVVLQVAEGEIERIQVRFINKEGSDRDAKGNPIRGRTRDFIITRELELKPGQVFNRQILERDFQRLFGLGLFEDLRPSLDVGEDRRKVVLVVNAVEKNTGNIGLAGGFSSASGFFGSLSYGQQNVGGNNQKLNAEVQIGQRDQQYELSFTDPWIAGDPYRTSYTLSVFRRRTISLIFDGGDPEVRLGNEDRDRPRINRTGGGISFARPLSRNVFERAEWTASLGLQYQRVTATDADGIRRRVDELGNPLTFDPSGKDDLFTGQLVLRRDRRNDFLQPTGGSVLQFSTEQSLPIGSGSIFFNRLRGSYSFYIPTRLTKFTPECRDRDTRRVDLQNQPQGRCAQAFAFNIQGGTILGDVPPYEAFPLGGTNSVRGYDEGDVGSGKSYLQATAEYRFPIFSIISGALFVDAATDLGSGDKVPGNPAGVRGKPGSGLGYGVGVRVRSPLGPIRIDFGWNDQGGNNIRFGFGERF
ncbi:BamA/TamA family outer membrane protein [Leptolyngbya boryana CZ1]|nr:MULTISPECIES: BamA/TamA family outer membrane protein [Leptolyngbya]MBD1858855.1 BamA/TamA family outer membrane protein [Leptolyngbya sp. FACHB-1624]MBD2370734.1 BamA/TamA family outer membrane protein [Leptolyngbya sp. FACHB-161]MBD2377113.1 BamA/TamA family outer membrane protein [Leptolyngbya sp. FACHB-238]MBD2401556.1 BamA/TamA family outer membrane protein [Leptolyngbya sp. FACHB-239]MBD2408108.1 BamA/TamA family outer membrane protein [Leptolyngbya sp. FACHB-402]